MENTLSRALLIRAFESAVTLGLYLGLTTRAELNKCLEQATVRVFKRAGLNNKLARESLGVSATTYQRLNSRSSEPELNRFPIRLLVQLQQGPMTEEQVYALFRQYNTVAYELERVPVCLGLLEKLGFVGRGQIGRETSYHLVIPAPFDLSASKEQLQNEVQVSLACTLMGHLAFGPVHQRPLQATIEKDGIAPEEIQRSLAWLQEQGMVTARYHPDDPDNPILQLSQQSLTFVPKLPEERLHVGLIDMFSVLANQLPVILKDPDRADYGQRTFRFNARPEDVEAFIRRHRKNVIEELTPIDAAARDDGREYAFFWVLSEMSKPT